MPDPHKKAGKSRQRTWVCPTCTYEEKDLIDTDDCPRCGSPIAWVRQDEAVAWRKGNAMMRGKQDSLKPGGRVLKRIITMEEYRRRCRDWTNQGAEEMRFLEATNAAYLAALLDLKGFGARRSNRTNKALHVSIRLTSTAEWAKEQWPLIKKAYEIRADIANPIQKGKSAIQGEVGQAEREPAYEIYIDDPASVKKLLVAARPYMWKRKKADEVIAACDELLATESDLLQ